MTLWTAQRHGGRFLKGGRVTRTYSSAPRVVAEIQQAYEWICLCGRTNWETSANQGDRVWCRRCKYPSLIHYVKIPAHRMGTINGLETEAHAE